jgi:hypothetical protein
MDTFDFGNDGETEITYMFFRKNIHSDAESLRREYQPRLDIIHKFNYGKDFYRSGGNPITPSRMMIVQGSDTFSMDHFKIYGASEYGGDLNGEAENAYVNIYGVNFHTLGPVSDDDGRAGDTFIPLVFFLEVEFENRIAAWDFSENHSLLFFEEGMTTYTNTTQNLRYEILNQRNIYLGNAVAGTPVAKPLLLVTPSEDTFQRTASEQMAQYYKMGFRFIPRQRFTIFINKLKPYYNIELLTQESTVLPIFTGAITGRDLQDNPPAGGERTTPTAITTVVNLLAKLEGDEDIAMILPEPYTELRNPQDRDFTKDLHKYENIYAMTGKDIEYAIYQKQIIFSAFHGIIRHGQNTSTTIVPSNIILVTLTQPGFTTFFPLTARIFSLYRKMFVVDEGVSPFESSYSAFSQFLEKFTNFTELRQWRNHDQFLLDRYRPSDFAVLLKQRPILGLRMAQIAEHIQKIPALNICNFSDQTKNNKIAPQVFFPGMVTYNLEHSINLEQNPKFNHKTGTFPYGIFSASTEGESDQYKVLLKDFLVGGENYEFETADFLKAMSEDLQSKRINLAIVFMSSCHNVHRSAGNERDRDVIIPYYELSNNSNYTFNVLESLFRTVAFEELFKEYITTGNIITGENERFLVGKCDERR